MKVIGIYLEHIPLLSSFSLCPQHLNLNISCLLITYFLMIFRSSKTRQSYLP